MAILYYGEELGKDLPLRGSFVKGTWQYDPALYAPPRYRRACAYEAFIPDLLDSLPSIAPEVAGTISAAEDAIRQLNAVAEAGLQPLARLLLRTESIASSKVEGMQVDARTLARAEARSDVGHSIGHEAAEILANIDAMQLAVDHAAAAEDLALDHVLDTHRTLLAGAARAAELAASYLAQVQELQAVWRERLAALGTRADAAAWRVIDVLPGHPIISTPVAVEATGRTKPAVQQGIDQLVRAGVLLPLSGGKRNRQWEADGLLDLSADFDSLHFP